MAHRTCTLDGCGKPLIARGLCGKHYASARSNGTLPEDWPRKRVTPTGPCTVEGCTKPMFATNLCGMHYRRVWANGTLEGTAPKRGSEAPGWVGDDATYRTVHSRLVALRGKAADHVCVDCGGSALEWSYDHSDPNEKHDRRGGDYSVDPERYEPRCRRCHYWFDHA